MDNIRGASHKCFIIILACLLTPALFFLIYYYVTLDRKNVYINSPCVILNFTYVQRCYAYVEFTTVEPHNREKNYTEMIPYSDAACDDYINVDADGYYNSCAYRPKTLDMIERCKIYNPDEKYIFDSVYRKKYAYYKFFLITGWTLFSFFLCVLFIYFVMATDCQCHYNYVMVD